MIWILIAVVIIAIIAAVFLMRGRSQQSDGMSTFRKQIDALSPEARKPVVDQVEKAKNDGRSHVRRTDATDASDQDK